MSLVRCLPVASRWVLPLAVVAALLPAAGGAAPPAAADDPRARLVRMHAAAFQRNYQGTMVFAAGGGISSSRVAHFCVGNDSYERVESLDGPPRQVLRHNDTVHTLWPQAAVMRVEKRGSASPGGAMTDRVDPRALDHYELRVEGRDRVAGREAEVLLMLPRDGLRYAQRLWSDLATGLMLRADVLGSERQVLESSAFSQLETGVRPQPDALLRPLRQLAGWKVVHSRHDPVALEDEGWELARPLPGFRLTGSLRRPLDFVPSTDADDAASMLQAVFSDGLTQVSLFIERYEPSRHRKDLQARIGATTTLAQRRGDAWLTVMGDVPLPTLRQLLDAVQPRRR